MENFEGLDSFLSQVEEIESIVKGLNSDDAEKVKRNMAKADEIIKKAAKDDETEVEGIKTKTKLNRSVINKYGDDDPGPVMKQPTNMSQEAFMAAMEFDAQERYKRKQESRKVANELKDKGNEEFKQGNVEKAIEFYTEAITHIRDMTVLYTNRAQAYIKVGKHKEAISDCEWALRVDEKCLKALIHKGRAYTYLKEFDQALEQFEQAKTVDPKQVALIDDYIREMERCRKADAEEKALSSFLSEENSGQKKDVIETLKDILSAKIYKKDQNLIYYAGGLRLIANLCNDVHQKTLFRVENGFNIFQEHQIISKYFKKESFKEELDASELQLLSGAFELFQIICQDCDENVRTLFGIDEFPALLLKYLQINFGAKEKSIAGHGRKSQIEILRFLLQLSKSDFGTLKIVDSFEIDEFLEALVIVCLLSEAKKATNESALIRSFASQTLLNCVLNSRFLKKLRASSVDAFVRNMLDLMRKIPSLGDEIKFNLVTALYALTSESAFRAAMVEVEDLWKHAIDSINCSGLEQINETKKELFNNTCNLLINLTSAASTPLDSHSETLTRNAIEASNIDQVSEKPLSLLGNILQRSSKKSDLIKLLDKAFIIKLISNVKANKFQQQSVKLLAICTQLDSSANTNRNIIAKKDNSLGFLYALFKDVSQDYAEGSKINLKNLNESLLNNAILCMGHCVDANAQAAHLLTEENIIMDLVYLARDGHNKELQKNCGILIAKLCKQDNKHLERLRELHGIEILHTALKNTEL